MLVLMVFQTTKEVTLQLAFVIHQHDVSLITKVINVFVVKLRKSSQVAKKMQFNFGDVPHRKVALTFDHPKG